MIDSNEIYETNHEEYLSSKLKKVSMIHLKSSSLLHPPLDFDALLCKNPFMKLHHMPKGLQSPKRVSFSHHESNFGQSSEMFQRLPRKGILKQNLKYKVPARFKHIENFVTIGQYSESSESFDSDDSDMESNMELRNIKKISVSETKKYNYYSNDY